ncbi:ScbA/BarX family gamma-butyrolactone biosynthesis protein [Streptomyces lydicus]|uniref:ScbA/BarX family gamma-butyrolactone biosynthesis protein n=1 Tax=Streptomyces lydicus TaxID=47763 RepID=UPI0010110586|nr:ScbA/BarX family gamma-butyrolactone biosynthesis protein [Streptomyces lydicus]MCZ1011558.1 ScbA/BarX family gamma-butyrolactone biosynthesis protein [Streptomyces lydicus]
MSDTMHVSGTVQPRAPHQTHSEGNHRTPPGRHHAPCVPQEFVHRPIVDDILVTSWHRLDDSRFTLTAQWPHDHGYFTPTHGRHHLILTGETIRQAGLLLCHTELGVPVGHHFILGNLVYTTHPEHLAVGRGPTRLTIDVTCSRMRLRGGTLSSGHFAMTLRKAGRIVATGHSDVTVTSPAVYRRIRGERLAARRTLDPLPVPVPHQLTGSAMDSDVLLSPTDGSGRWELRIAPGHGAMVNPANDHIPGMLLLDAAQQAARALTAPRIFVPYAFGTEFHRYAEHGVPCTLAARHVPSALPSTTTVQVTGCQEGKPVFVSTLTALDARH